MINKISNMQSVQYMRNKNQVNPNKSNISFGTTTQSFYHLPSILRKEVNLFGVPLNDIEEQKFLIGLKKEIENGKFNFKLNHDSNLIFNCEDGRVLGCFPRSKEKPENINLISNTAGFPFEEIETIKDKKMSSNNKMIWESLKESLMEFIPKL